MRTLSRLQWATIVTMLVFFALVFSNGCKSKTTSKPADDIPANVQVNPLFEQAPPVAGTITIQQLSNNNDGNILFVADFGTALGKETFHAVMLGDEKVVLRDDGKKGDEKPGDGKFSIILNEDINTLQQELESSVNALRNQKELVSFSGRAMVHTPIDKLDLPDFAKFREGAILRLPPFFIPCLPTTMVIKENSLMVTAPSVVEDTTRTFNPCSRIGRDTGVWAFPRLISEMANTPLTGVSASDFLKRWLGTWLTDVVTVNSDVITKRTQINNIINTWSSLSGGTFDIKFAPFKLIAIVNRVDLRGNSGYGTGNPGEGRFVFCAINCRGGVASVLRNPAPFMIIFEYGLPQKGCAAQRAFAKQWADLSGMALGSPAYNAALEAVTNQFTMANTSPGKANGSSLNQVRTNELALAVTPWELREFNIDSATHLLKNVTVKQEPQLRFNKQHPLNVAADVQTMVDFVNTHTASVQANTYTIQEIEAGKHFLAAKAHTLNPSTYHWNGGTVAANPDFITSDSARFILSLNTCSGCHGGEANTGNFMHVAPGGAAGVPAFLSGFLKGNPPMSAGGFVVNDRANRPVAPGKPREFNDLERRKLDLEKFVSCPCKRKVRVFELADVLTRRPLNMTH